VVSENEKTGPQGPVFQSLLALVSVCLQTLAVFVLRHLLSTLLYQRTHAKTSQKRGDDPNGRVIGELGQTKPAVSIGSLITVAPVSTNAAATRSAVSTLAMATTDGPAPERAA